MVDVNEFINTLRLTEDKAEVLKSNQNILQTPDHARQIFTLIFNDEYWKQHVSLVMEMLNLTPRHFILSCPRLNGTDRLISAGHLYDETAFLLNPIRRTI